MQQTGLLGSEHVTPVSTVPEQAPVVATQVPEQVLDPLVVGGLKTESIIVNPTTTSRTKPVAIKTGGPHASLVAARPLAAAEAALEAS